MKWERNWEEGELENTRKSKSDKEGEKEKASLLGPWCREQPKVGKSLSTYK